MFSIVIPVRNGMPFIRECVASVLAQTLGDFDLLVLDNQSTDGTAEWLAEQRDPRIRVLTSAEPLSIVDSWGRIKRVPKREFMTVIGHDDLLDPWFLEVIDGLIRDHPHAVLYQVGARLTNATGKIVRTCPPVPRTESAADYMRSRFRFERDVSGTGYVMRSRDYDRVGGIPPFERLFFADDALWLALLKGSHKVFDPRVSVSVRVHAGSESASLPRAWPSILKALQQFGAFLREYVADEPECAEVVTTLGSAFLLTYHRNVYIFALLEACEESRRIDPAVVARIRASLDATVPGLGAQLDGSLKTRLVAMLNALPLRVFAMRLWNMYYGLRTRAG